MEDPIDLIKALRVLNPDIYGIDWGADTVRERYKPVCQHPDCSLRVSTEFGKPKPFCKDHVEENPYVKDLLKRIEKVDLKEDRKRTEEAFQKLIESEK